MTQPIPLPYGLRDLKVTPFTDNTLTAYGASVDLPNIRTLSFAEVVESQELRGDDALKATHETAPSVEWELESGGVSYEAARVMVGGTVSESGSTPNRIKRFYKTEDDARPYFKIEGQAISDSGGDVHCIIYRAKATGNFEGTFGDQEFFLSGFSGVGLGSLVPATLKRVWEFVQNETTTAIA